MIVKKLLIYILISSCLFGTACKSSTNTKNTSSTSKPKPTAPKTLFKFEQSNTLSAVLDKAAKANKPIFVDFYTSWCTPCKMMDQDIFTNRNLADYYNKNFLSYKVDCEKGNGVNLASIYGINNYPTLLYLDEKGNILVKHESAAYHTKMEQLAKDALFEYNNRSTQ